MLEEDFLTEMPHLVVFDAQATGIMPVCKSHCSTASSPRSFCWYMKQHGVRWCGNVRTNKLFHAIYIDLAPCSTAVLASITVIYST